MFSVLGDKLKSSLVVVWKALPQPWEPGSRAYKRCLTNTAQFITGDCLPLSLVESPAFRAFCKRLDPKSPDFDRKAPNIEIQDLKNTAVEKLSGLEDWSVAQTSYTCDLWSIRAQMKFITLTGHWVTEKKGGGTEGAANGWVLERRVLATVGLGGERATAENIALITRVTVAGLGMIAPCPTVTIDSEANVKKAFDGCLA
ncbi:hypothetical protein BSKO_02534 [Bryopsis sp. KO-2023]|nr:hypothetical protein BSKO_02534 [Bryopsis sp. KO-2023]